MGEGRAPQRISRKVARDRVRSSLVSAASELFGTVGFDSSTTADIAERAGVSQRTFFRYFACKEDVALEWLDAYNLKVCERLRGRPADEPLLDTLRRALDPFCEMSGAELGRAEAIQRLASDSLTLRARLLSRLAEWEGHIAAELEARGIGRVQAAFLGNFAVGVLTVAFRECLTHAGPTLEALIDRGFDVLKGRFAGDR